MASLSLDRAPGEPVSKVELFVNVDNLALVNLGQVQYGQCCSLFTQQTNDQWIEVGCTELINSRSPKFTKPFELDYYFEDIQRLLFKVYILIDDPTVPRSSLNARYVHGEMECTLGEVVSGGRSTRPLGFNSTISLLAQEIGDMNDVIQMTFSAKGLDKKDLIGKSDAYLELSRLMPGGSYLTVLRTEVVKDSLKPSWKPIAVKVSRLCGGDIYAQFKVDCYDQDIDGSHDLIGTFITTVAECMQATTMKLKWPCINPKKIGTKKYENSGVIHLKSCTVTKSHSFLDYVFGGLQINFTVGIDFTASNGNPTSASSLHNLNQRQPNTYMKAIKSVGTVIQDYDSDKMFPVLGFGAKIPPEMKASHCFAVNFNAANPYCAGIQGVLDEYSKCLSEITLDGPSNFSPIILHVAQFAAAAKKENSAKNYFVLLIITNGAIADIEETVSAIVYASSLPLSIIIVGVGSFDFSAMDALDSDTGLLQDTNGRVAQRDIVQFVPLRKFKNEPPNALEKQVLAEIPDQVSKYYQLNNIPPGMPAASVKQTGCQ